MLFATKDTLVCETPEDAMTVAYHLRNDDGSEKRLSAVALDGTLYTKSGLVSGGKMDLERKARRWGQKNVLKMKTKRNNLLEELKSVQSVTREESELKILEAQVRKGGREKERWREEERKKDKNKREGERKKGKEMER